MEINEEHKEHRIKKTLTDYALLLKEKGHTVLYVGLYGSQNYNLDDEKSDIDAKAIILLPFKETIMQQTFSKVYKTEHGEISVCDSITFLNRILKGSFTDIESVQTNYYVGSKELRNTLLYARPSIGSIYGAIRNNLKNYETNKDPKYYVHATRLGSVGFSLIDDEHAISSFGMFFGNHRDSLLDKKRGKIPIEQKDVDELKEHIEGWKFPTYISNISPNNFITQLGRFWGLNI